MFGFPQGSNYDFTLVLKIIQCMAFRREEITNYESFEDAERQE